MYSAHYFFLAVTWWKRIMSRFLICITESAKSFTFLFHQQYVEYVSFHVSWWIICSLTVFSGIQCTTCSAEIRLSCKTHPFDTRPQGQISSRYFLYGHHEVLCLFTEVSCCFIQCVNSKSSTAKFICAFKKCLYNMKTVLVQKHLLQSLTYMSMFEIKLGFSDGKSVRWIISYGRFYKFHLRLITSIRFFKCQKRQHEKPTIM